MEPGESTPFTTMASSAAAVRVEHLADELTRRTYARLVEAYLGAGLPLTLLDDAMVGAVGTASFAGLVDLLAEHDADGAALHQLLVLVDRLSPISEA